MGLTIGMTIVLASGGAVLIAGKVAISLSG